MAGVAMLNLVGQLGPQRPAQVGHVREVGDAALPDPPKNLTGMKPRG